MKLTMVSGAALLMIFGLRATLCAQTVTQPGQMASTGETALQPTNLVPAASSSVLPPKTDLAATQGGHDRVLNRVWISSMFAVGAASGLDAATSWGKREGNPLLASPQGTFGAKGVSIKVGIAAAVLLPQVLVRKHRGLKEAFTIGNFGDAALFSAIAVHNMGLATPSSH